MVIDKEINTVAMLTEIMLKGNFKWAIHLKLSTG
jgi:hypothetical protein